MSFLPRISSRLLASSIICLAAVSGCGKSEDAYYRGQEPAGMQSAGASRIAPAFLSPSGLGVPAWGKRPSWENAVLKVVGARFADFNKARDVETFCPGYRRTTKRAQMHCWVMLAAAIAKFESAFKPETSFREPDGKYSIGLMALSPGECPNAPKHEDLKKAEANLICGMNRMATLIKRYENIDGPADFRGASRYWSTLRAPYKFWDASRGKHLNLGKRNLILPLVNPFQIGGTGRIVSLIDAGMDEPLDFWAHEPRELE